MEVTKNIRVRVDLLKNALEAMKNNRFTTHRVVCDIYMLAPSGKRKSVAFVYRSKQIASYKDGVLTFEAYIPSFWGDEKYKYEVLCEIAENLGIGVVYKQAKKSAPRKKTTTKKRTVKPKTNGKK